MKTTIENKQVTLVSENPKEARKLLDFVLSEMVEVEKQATPKHTQPKKKAHKKHLFTFNCRYCHKACRGKVGRGIHEKRTHGKLYSTQNLPIINNTHTI